MPAAFISHSPHRATKAANSARPESERAGAPRQAVRTTLPAMPAVIPVRPPDDRREAEANEVVGSEEDPTRDLPPATHAGSPTVGAPPPPPIADAALASFGRDVPPIVRSVLRSIGQPLDPAARAFMESRFRHDFSRVRVHSDTTATQSARVMRARAYTIGRDVILPQTDFAPHDLRGLKLLAHELAHVIQQERGGSVPAISSGAAHEREADLAAESVITEGAHVTVNYATGLGIARAPLDETDTDDEPTYTVSMRLGDPPRLKPRKRSKPVIKYYTDDELERLIGSTQEEKADQTGKISSNKPDSSQEEMSIVKIVAFLRHTEPALATLSDETRQTIHLTSNGLVAVGGYTLASVDKRSRHLYRWCWWPFPLAKSPGSSHARIGI